MQRGLETSLVQARDQCKSDVTEADLSCCSQSTNVFCLLMCLRYFVIVVRRFLLLGGMMSSINIV